MLEINGKIKLNIIKIKPEYIKAVIKGEIKQVAIIPIGE